MLRTTSVSRNRRTEVEVSNPAQCPGNVEYIRYNIMNYGKNRKDIDILLQCMTLDNLETKLRRTL